MAILTINNLNISVMDSACIVDGSFSVDAGDVVLLTGPNGCGKSTIIKVIVGDVFDYKDLKYDSSVITYNLNGTQIDVLGTEKERESFRKSICYISQEDDFESPRVLDCFKMSLNYYAIKNKERYVFDFIRKHNIYKAFANSELPEIDAKERLLAKRIKLDLNHLDDADKQTLYYLTRNINRMSGGQKKLTNIASNLIRYSFCNLIILDEPLNNLDYSNVRSFSNILTSICKEKPELGVIIVTHCRSIPVVNKILEIKDKRIVDGGQYNCSSCFGKINDQCMYI